MNIEENPRPEYIRNILKNVIQKERVVKEENEFEERQKLFIKKHLNIMVTYAIIQLDIGIVLCQLPIFH